MYTRFHCQGRMESEWQSLASMAGDAEMLAKIPHHGCGIEDKPVQGLIMGCGVDGVLEKL